MTTPTTFRLWDVPMAHDRTAGWRLTSGLGEVFQAADGTWMLTSAEAVRFAHRHPEIFSSALAFGATGLPLPLIPVAIDPPEHVRYRRILDPMLAPRVVNALEDDLRAQIRELVLAFADRGECDVVRDVARLYPTQVFLTLFGLPLSDRDDLIGWVETMNEHSTTGTAEPDPTVMEASMAMFAYLRRYISTKREDPGDGMLGHILSLQGDEAWSDDEALGLTFLFSLAGLDTVTGAIGFTMLLLARDPDLRRRLIAEPMLTAPVIEEALRLEPPAPTTPRVTTRDVDVCGVRIPAGSPVMLCLATTNREAGRYEHPDEVDLAQADRAHVTFGGGIHRCLGAHLARRELRLVVEEFHALIPEYEVAPGFEPEVVWPSSTLHLASLPLVFPVAGGAARRVRR
ncbi:MAG: cytochrome P450 [Acidimicrobiia bacterium]